MSKIGEMGGEVIVIYPKEYHLFVDNFIEEKPKKPKLPDGLRITKFQRGK